jgi:25S rRNA (uracil2634-N3)-methyltransferase
VGQSANPLSVQQELEMSEKRNGSVETSIGKHFICQSTLNCIYSGCVPCLYKAFPLGIQGLQPKNQAMLRSDAFPPNARPETCLRSKTCKYNGLQQCYGPVLIVGDGDFSFSLSLAQSGSHAPKQLTVSSYEAKSALLEIYPTAAANVSALECLGVTIMYEVDATQLHLTSALKDRQFDLILWNFPCICADNGADGQTSELASNQALITSFFQSIKAFLYLKRAEVHITHKTIEPFSWWELERLAQAQGFHLVLDVVFDKCGYPGYINRKAWHRRSFPCHDARVRPSFICVACCTHDDLGRCFCVDVCVQCPC